MLRHLKHIEYRTLACGDMVEARAVEMRLKHAAKGEGGVLYRFMT
ncbi:MAG: hypothetical protein ACI89L_001528 [Phycisphaerales bacterium]